MTKWPYLLLGLVSVSTVADTRVHHVKQVTVEALGTTYVGKVSDKQPKVDEYLGIPFALPPIGERRWRAPSPILKTPEEYNSQNFKPACYQRDYNLDWYKQVAALFGTHNLAMQMPPVSEDCLYLNIWKPKEPDSPLLPVMIWIHGGSNKAGWSYEPNYLGQELANTGNVIVVSIAYRLGVFGFLAHPEFSHQSAKTNFGILDQIAALEWVQKNIRYFGGNKDNVTVFGESAGAANIGYLMSTPKAQGLFHQAISQSGGFQMLADSALNQGERLGTQLSAYFDNSNAEQLRQISADKIWQATEKVAPDYDFRALQDDVLFDQPLSLAFANNANVNLMVGSNKNEYYMYLSHPIDKPELAFVPSELSLSKALFKQFSLFKESKLGQDWLDTFLYMACPSALMAELVTNNQQQAWLYRFDRTRDNGERIKAYHGAEIPYVFDTHDDFLPTNKIDQTLTDIMMGAWVNFARYGDPNGSSEGFPKSAIEQSKVGWPAYSQDSPGLLVFDQTVNHSIFEQHALCQQLWPSYVKRKSNNNE